MTATLDSIDDHKASHETSGCSPTVLVTMMRMTEKTMMMTPNPRTAIRPSFCDIDILRPMISQIGMAITRELRLVFLTTRVRAGIRTHQICDNVHGSTVPQTDQRALDMDWFRAFTFRPNASALLARIKMTPLTHCEGSTGDRIRDDTSNVRQNGDGCDNPPGDSGPFRLIGETAEKCKKAALDCPQTAPKEARGSKLALEIERPS